MASQLFPTQCVSGLRASYISPAHYLMIKALRHGDLWIDSDILSGAWASGKIGSFICSPGPPFTRNAVC